MRYSLVTGSSMEKYEKGPVIGHGTYGSVYKAVHKETGQVVAIKKVRVGEAKEGVSMAALREIKVLQEVQSPHVVHLIEVFPHKQNLLLVFEFMACDMERLIKDRSVPLPAAHIKAYMLMLLKGLEHIHSLNIVHRDVKPNNLLLAASGELKLADFGLARLMGTPDAKYTNQVFARWYRPPELLFGATQYDAAVDMWAVGCVFAELMLRQVWFPGSSDVDQLERIFQALGSPNAQDWPEMLHLPNYVQWQHIPAPGLCKLLPNASEDALSLLAQLMRHNPQQRPTAAEALQHPYFAASPLPVPVEQLRQQPNNRRERAPLQALHVPSMGNSDRFSNATLGHVEEGGAPKTFTTMYSSAHHHTHHLGLPHRHARRRLDCTSSGSPHVTFLVDCHPSRDHDHHDHVRNTHPELHAPHHQQYQQHVQQQQQQQQQQQDEHVHMFPAHHAAHHSGQVPTNHHHHRHQLTQPHQGPRTRVFRPFDDTVGTWAFHEHHVPHMFGSPKYQKLTNDTSFLIDPTEHIEPNAKQQQQQQRDVTDDGNLPGQRELSFHLGMGSGGLPLGFRAATSAAGAYAEGASVNFSFHHGFMPRRMSTSTTECTAITGGAAATISSEVTATLCEGGSYREGRLSDAMSLGTTGSLKRPRRLFESDAKPTVVTATTERDYNDRRGNDGSSSICRNRAASALGGRFGVLGLMSCGGTANSHDDSSPVFFSRCQDALAMPMSVEMASGDGAAAAGRSRLGWLFGGEAGMLDSFPEDNKELVHSAEMVINRGIPSLSAYYAAMPSTDDHWWLRRGAGRQGSCRDMTAVDEASEQSLGAAGTLDGTASGIGSAGPVDAQPSVRMVPAEGATYPRPQLTSTDLRYLRRRKLDMDEAFLQASQDEAYTQAQQQALEAAPEPAAHPTPSHSLPDDTYSDANALDGLPCRAAAAAETLGVHGHGTPQVPCYYASGGEGLNEQAGSDGEEDDDEGWADVSSEHNQAWNHAGQMQMCCKDAQQAVAAAAAAAAPHYESATLYTQQQQELSADTQHGSGSMALSSQPGLMFAGGWEHEHPCYSHLGTLQTEACPSGYECLQSSNCRAFCNLGGNETFPDEEYCQVNLETLEGAVVPADAASPIPAC